MENTIPVNAVNISLSEYNVMKSNLEASRDLLTKATTELNLLRQKQADNKIVVIEKKEYDSNYGYKTKQKLELDIKDPKVANEILDIISKVETSELETKISDKEVQCRELKAELDQLREAYSAAERSFNSDKRLLKDEQKEEIRKLVKGYKESIEELEEDKETLQKSLADLKVNKTQEQLEIAREQEITDLKNKINALSEVKETIESINRDYKGFKAFFKIKEYLDSIKFARKFREDNPWVRNLWTNTMTALERVQSYANVMKSVGKLDKKSSNGSSSKINGYRMEWNGYSYIQVPVYC